MRGIEVQFILLDADFGVERVEITEKNKVKRFPQSPVMSKSH